MGPATALAVKSALTRCRAQDDGDVQLRCSGRVPTVGTIAMDQAKIEDLPAIRGCR